MDIPELNRIKTGIEQHIGKKVWLRANRGRSRCVENEGILKKTFPSVFTVQICGEEERQISYTYGELLTKNLEMKLLE